MLFCIHVHVTIGIFKNVKKTQAGEIDGLTAETKCNHKPTS